MNSPLGRITRDTESHRITLDNIAEATPLRRTRAASAGPLAGAAAERATDLSAGACELIDHGFAAGHLTGLGRKNHLGIGGKGSEKHESRRNKSKPQFHCLFPV
jgi:hypothetical protein